jgi:hypothetical protein
MVREFFFATENDTGWAGTRFLPSPFAGIRQFPFSSRSSEVFKPLRYRMRNVKEGLADTDSGLQIRTDNNDSFESVADYRGRRERWSLVGGMAAESHRFSGEMYIQDEKTYHLCHRTR